MTGSQKKQAFPRERQQLDDVAYREQKGNTSHVKYTQEKKYTVISL